MSSPGYIYVLINYSMSNLVKVGKTSRDTESRAIELSSVTGVPTPFLVAFDAHFNDCDEAEIYIHSKLEQLGYRISENREFFQAPLKEVIALIVEAKQLLQSQATSTENDSTVAQPNEEIQDASPEYPWSEIEALATYYYNSENYEEAYSRFKQALAMGSPYAYSPLGNMTLRGLGCLEDEQEALAIFEAGVQAKDDRCCADLATYYFAKDFMTGAGWFEKYLESGKYLHPATVFHCCVNFVMFEKYSRYGYPFKNLLEKYRPVFSPMKDSIISYAIKQINHVTTNYPDMKPLYVQVAQDIKKLPE
jgi:tetratricopeptide (TPR) repeat protein